MILMSSYKYDMANIIHAWPHQRVTFYEHHMAQDLITTTDAVGRGLHSFPFPLNLSSSVTV